MPTTEIITSGNATLSYLLATKNRDAKKAIVSKDGSGHFDNLKDAVDSGVELIVIKDGEYDITEDITLNNQNILGVSKKRVILNFINCSLKMDNSGDETEGDATKPIALAFESKIVGQGSGSSPGFNNVTLDENTKLYAESLLAKVEEISADNLLKMQNKFYGRGIELSNWNLYNENSSEIRLENLTIKQSATSTNSLIKLVSKNNRIENCYLIADNSDYSKLIETSADSTEKPTSKNTIKNCLFEGGEYGIYINNLSMTEIEDCYFLKQKEWSIYGESKFTLSHIKNNIFSGSGNGIYSEGIENSISNNEFETIKSKCISIPKTGRTNQIISDNTFLNCGDDTNPLIFSSFHNLTIEGNNFENCDGYCIESDSNLYTWKISKNVFNNCNKPIKYWGFGFTISYNKFINCPSGSTGIEKTAGTSNIICNNTFEDITPINSIANDAFNFNYISYSSETSLSITAGGAGINGNSFIKTKLTIGSTLDGIRSNSFITIASGYALTITGDKELIAGNLFEDCVNGVDIQSSADKTHLIENIFQNITTTPILNNGTNTVQSNNIL